MATMQQQRNRRTSTLQRIYAAVAAGFLAVLPAGTASATQDACRRPPEPAQEVPELPWAQQWFAPERLRPLSRGQDVVVAVIDSGVDTRHPQLRDARVLAGTDLLSEPAGAHVDCESHGTAVASIIAATPVDGIGFAGLAPDAQILPIRVAEQGVATTGPDRPSQVDADTFARAVDWAVAQDAQVINVSVVFYQDDPAIAEAVGRAVDRGVVVVAAVGPAQPDPSADAPIPYPAAYPGVLGVGSFELGANGTPELASAAGPFLDLVAPGEAVTAAAAPAGHHATWSGSSFAAPFVSATAALLLAADPELPAGTLAEQLVATGDPGPAGPAGTAYPVVNPYRALTERRADGPPVAAGPPEPEVADPAAAARAARWDRAGRLAATVTIAAATALALAAGGAAVWRRGQQRGWRPAPSASRPAARSAPEPAPGEAERAFYIVPTPRDRHRP